MTKDTVSVGADAVSKKAELSKIKIFERFGYDVVNKIMQYET